MKIKIISKIRKYFLNLEARLKLIKKYWSKWLVKTNPKESTSHLNWYILIPTPSKKINSLTLMISKTIWQILIPLPEEPLSPRLLKKKIAYLTQTQSNFYQEWQILEISPLEKKEVAMKILRIKIRKYLINLMKNINKEVRLKKTI